MRIADAQPARVDRIVTGLHRFVALVHDMLRRGDGLEDEAWAYAGDLLIVLQWCVQHHHAQLTLGSLSRTWYLPARGLLQAL